MNITFVNSNPTFRNSKKSLYRAVFPKQHTLLPVIHTKNKQQVLENASIARDAGADGVFLIDHEGVQDLEELYYAVQAAHPGWWVGLNCLGFSPKVLFTVLSPTVQGVWTDNAMIDESLYVQAYAQHVTELIKDRMLYTLYFGGVAFKYQQAPKDLTKLCKIAERYVDVVTTSGPGTGLAPIVDKIKRMRAAIPLTPIAIASGITPENVTDYLPYADCFLVATGISKDFYMFDPSKLNNLARKIRKLPDT